MKKTPRKIQRTVHNLGELIELVNSCTRNRGAATAAVADMIETGRIRFESGGQKLRAHIC